MTEHTHDPNPKGFPCGHPARLGTPERALELLRQAVIVLHGGDPTSGAPLADDVSPGEALDTWLATLTPAECAGVPSIIAHSVLDTVEALTTAMELRDLPGIVGASVDAVEGARQRRSDPTPEPGDPRLN